MKLIDMSDYNRAAKAYWAFMVLAGSIVVGWSIKSFQHLSASQWMQFAALLSLVALASFFPIRIPSTNSSFTASDVFTFLACLLLGVPAAVAVGVLGQEKREGAAQGGPVGLLFNASLYVPLSAAHDWLLKHRNPMGEVALALARQSGQLNESQSEGYSSAVVRVSDPVALTEVRTRLTELGFGSFSIVDQLDQIRTVFLIIGLILGLLGGISLVVASFGIANTIIMSILERPREIGIMKAIGAE